MTYTFKPAGYTSSFKQKPPTLIPIAIYSPQGSDLIYMFHEDEYDGYDFENEKPQRSHMMLDNIEGEILWREYKKY